MNPTLLRKGCLLVTLLLSAISFQKEAASQDPFAADPFAADPFATSNRRPEQRNSLPVRFTVSDQDGSALSRIEIRGRGLLRPVWTNRKGEAVGNFDLSLQQKLQRQGHTRITFRATAPEDVLLANSSVSVNLNALMKSQTVEFEMEPGVRLSGRVVGGTDHEPVAGINVEAYSTDNAETRRESIASTDRDGAWTLVLPKSLSSVNLVVRAVKPGYLIDRHESSEDLYSRVVQLSAGRSRINELDFEIAQVPPLTVKVTDESGKPMQGARVSVSVKYWADDTTGWWNSGSGQEVTDGAGTCTLFQDRIDQQAVVMVSVLRNGKELHGRKAIQPLGDKPQQADVVVRPMSKVQGTLRWGQQPAKNTSLVLYEATENANGKWVDFGIRGETTTDDQGRYEFSAIRGLHYFVATKKRNKSGVQAVLHRTDEQVTAPAVQLPEVDLRKIAAN